MDTILCLLHTDADGTIPRTGLESLRAASELAAGGGALQVGLIGKGACAASAAAAGTGATRVMCVDDNTVATSRYATDLAAAEALARKAEATLIIAPATSRFARTLPGLAVRLEGRIDTGICAIAAEGDAVNVERWFYRQRMKGTLSRANRPWVLLTAPGVWEAWTPGGEAPTCEDIAAAVDSRTTVEGVVEADAGTQTIRPDAELLFVTGAGWTKTQADGSTHLEDAEKAILPFLELARASLGSSKSLVDQSSEGQAVLSFLSHLNQIGQTGATPRHAKGLATCCHGEEPHVVGWRFVNDRRAVNLDPGCGWALGKADVLYVADAFAVVKKVNELLAEG